MWNPSNVTIALSRCHGHLILCCFFILIKIVASTNEGTNDEEIMAHLVDWVRAKGAYISAKVEVRSLGTNKLSGIFAKESLDEGEVVSSIPPDIVIASFNGEHEDWCGVLWAVHKAITKDSSVQTPYERYLATRQRDYHPSFWSEQGKAMLKELLGEMYTQLQFGFEEMIERWMSDCEVTTDDIDDLLLNALMLVITRGDGPHEDILIPFNDNINHRNGKWFNTESTVSADQRYELVTTARVEAGEQLQSSYNQCEWCTNPFFATQQIFDRYGFIELMPQRWIIPQVRFIFDIDEKDDMPEVYFPVKPSLLALSYLQSELQRLDGFEHLYKNKTSTVPELERDIIWLYRDAFVAAVTHALDSADGHTSEGIWDSDDDEWLEKVWHSHNDNRIIVEEDDEDDEDNEDNEDNEDDEDHEDHEDDEEEDTQDAEAFVAEFDVTQPIWSSVA